MIITILPLMIAGFCMALAILGMLARINMRRFLGYAAIVDICFTAVMFGLFAGTYSGVVAGAIAGLTFTMALWGLKTILGYEKLVLAKRQAGHVSYYALGWKRYEGAWG